MAPRLYISNFSMKLFIKKSLFFAVFVLISFFVFLFAWGEFAPKKLQKNICPYIDGNLQLKIAEIKSYSDIDILFIGSSHCGGGFDPRIFKEAGYEKTFNLGTGAQCPVNTEALIKKYVPQLKPKLVIYEVYPRTFGDGGTESWVNLLVNNAFGDDNAKLILEQNNLMVYNTVVFQWMHNFFLGSFKPLPAIKPMGKYIPGGFSEKFAVCKKEYTFRDQSWKFNDDQKEAFARIIDYFKNNNIDFLLVQAPVSNVYFKSHTNNDEVDKYFTSYGEYVNYNNVLTLDDHVHFWDAHHVNMDGVKIFNSALIDYLANREK